MGKGSRGHPIPLLTTPGADRGRPRYVRLYRRIREAVLRGTLRPGTRLPSARTLARDEGISRNTVEAAFAQLQAEGFVTRRVGSGTFVSDAIPDLRRARRERDADGRPSEAPRPSARHAPYLSERGRSIAALGRDAEDPGGFLFAPCVPGYEAPSLATWNRLAARHARDASGAHLVSAPPGGLPTLREAVAEYVALARGVACTADQVVIVGSTQQALDLTARLVLDPGDAVWIEDPGYVSARRALRAAGGRLVPVPVDEEGMDVGSAVRLDPDARLCYVTPSHQYPLGVTLSLARRLALLTWAGETGSWVFEDDYDSEVRHDGPPLASLQGIDAHGRVVYAGTFNKILHPGLRLAYLVLPPALVEPFLRARAIADGPSPTLTQRVLAAFIQEGHLAVHLRAARTLYRERRDRFLDAASEHVGELARLGPAAAGMHVALHLRDGTDDEAVSANARRRGLALPALSSHYLGRSKPGLLAHYGNVPVAGMDDAVRTMARVLSGAAAWTVP